MEKKAIDKTQNTFMMKSCPESGRRGKLPQHNEGQIQQTHS